MSIYSVVNDINRLYPLYCSSINGVSVKNQIINLPADQIGANPVNMVAGFKMLGINSGGPSSVTFHYIVPVNLSSSVLTVQIINAETGQSLYTYTNPATVGNGFYSALLSLVGPLPAQNSICQLICSISGGIDRIEPLVLEINY